MTFQEVYNRVMPEKKRKEERFNIFAHWIGRPISILMTLPLINTKVKPTTVTKWSIAFTLVGFSLVSFGPNMSVKVVGWLCFLLWNLLDGVDGNLARCTNQCSQSGDLWDTMAGYAAMILTYFSAGIAAFYDINLINFCDNYWFLMLGGASAVMSIFPRLVMHKKKSANANSAAVIELSDKQHFGIKNIIAMNFVSPSGFMQVIFLLCIVFHMLNIFIVFYTFINFSIMLL
ncbi:MAG: CDP-alcohol phosphatidyltransferase family protein, partial [Eubacteriales bacterium]|nr:CDP-alcohol phosphatidyltransferase family protein [Eubacteriales bacterium]